MAKAFSKAGLAVAALAAVIVTKAVKAFAAFDTSMRNVFTLLPKMTEQGFNAMKDAVLDMSAALPATAEELGAG